VTTGVVGAAGQPRASDLLRTAISRGGLAPGRRLVERIPHRGARVRRISTAEAIAITACRMALRPCAA
jgi:DNA-binding GntR family transcriptional regulator